MNVSMSYGPQFLSPAEAATLLQTPVHFTPQEGGTLHGAAVVALEGGAELLQDQADLLPHLDQGRAVLLLQGAVHICADTDDSGDLELLVDTVIVVTSDAACRARAGELTAAGDPRLRTRLKRLILQVLAQMQVYGG